jgi:hypothetical protein
MISTLLLSVLLQPAPIPTVLAPCVLQEEGAESDAAARIAAAGNDVDKLMELGKALADEGKRDDSKTAYNKVLELQPDHEAAHKALRHHFYDNQWFESYAALSKYRREEAAAMEAKGLKKWKDEWVPIADIPFLNMNWEKGADGEWFNPVDVARAEQVAKWKEAGYEFRADDSTWVAPGDFDKWKEKLFQCGEEWLDLDKANEFHAQIGQWWKLEGEYFSTWTTCAWDGGNWARWYADKTYPDLVRIFGVQPAKKPHFVVLNSLDQYNKFAGGDQALQLPAAESEGFSSLHGAFFADVLFDPTVQPFQYVGCGVAYWDRGDDTLRAWGPYWLRFAAAQSYCEAIDPSWNAVGETIAGALSGGGGQPNSGAFWAEKRIPRWLRYGASSYVERYAKNPEAQDGGNPWDNREFAFGQVKAGGGLRKLEDVFAFGLDLADLEGSTRLYHEAGLVVAFLLDGAEGDGELKARHGAFKQALKSGKKDEALSAAIEGLQAALAQREDDIKAFAGL